MRSAEGMISLYKGTLTPLVGVGACVSIQFGVLEYMKRYFKQGNSAKPLTGQELFLGKGLVFLFEKVDEC